MLKELPRVIAIVGPTASGKTALAVRLAERFKGEVISADARQVYRGLDVGTDKITPDEMGGVPHHLIDVADVKEVFTAADFKRLGKRAIEETISREHVPIIAGGTGFYIEALLDGMILPEVPPDPELREKLGGESAEALLARLSKLDPDRAQTIDPRNRRRLVRAIEVAVAQGGVPERKAEAPYETLYIGLDLPDEVLRDRIRARAEKQVGSGLLEEAGRLMREVPKERLGELGFEYRLASEHLSGTITREELVQRLTEAHWQYVKRQRTWFKRNKRIAWFDPGSVEEIEARVAGFLNE